MAVWFFKASKEAKTWPEANFSGGVFMILQIGRFKPFFSPGDEKEEI